MTEQDASQAATDASTAQLVSRLGEQVSTLIRSELRLAQLELQEKGKRAGIGIGLFGGAGIVALLGAGRWWPARFWHWRSSWKHGSRHFSSASSCWRLLGSSRWWAKASTAGNTAVTQRGCRERQAGHSDREGATSLMTEPRTPTGVEATAPPSDPDALREEIEQTRAQLGDTVEALANKLDVKAQAKGAVVDAKDKAATTLSSVAVVCGCSGGTGA